mgnify:CR=1 FL=1
MWSVMLKLWHCQFGLIVDNVKGIRILALIVNLVRILILSKGSKYWHCQVIKLRLMILSEGSEHRHCQYGQNVILSKGSD